uniref:Uncharacterized protein n=1 Tax=Utricularia reniformis TaxID=192314 RepID=A0A1Y0B0D9_9LAMI|nr:hypothetical protein AEK19_MT0608 [Utricularia reniformis]ART30863.1 hypothetical protein AEK19_MT0608 [Utricularia reniformis]
MVNLPRAIVIVILLFNDFDHFRSEYFGASEDSIVFREFRF